MRSGALPVTRRRDDRLSSDQRLAGHGPAAVLLLPALPSVRPPEALRSEEAPTLAVEAAVAWHAVFKKACQSSYEIPIPLALSSSRFFMAFGPSLGCGHTSVTRDGAMSFLFDPNQELRLAELQEQLRRARTVTPDVMADVIAGACLRFHAHAPSAKAETHSPGRIGRLLRRNACADRAGAAAMEAPAPDLR